MKYLSNRDEFLKRSINKIDEYKSLENKDLEIINEGDSGPFANDIPWNDSLLGRLINSTIRKAKIGANLVRIKAVNRRLKDAFDDLLGKSAVSGLSKEEKAEFNKVLIFSFLENLKNSIEKEDNVGEIKRLTDEAIKNIEDVVENTPAEELSMDKDNLLNLINQLKEFRKFLDQFKDDEGGAESGAEEDTDELESEDTEGKEGEGAEDTEGSKSSEAIYPTMIKTLKSLSYILTHYKEVKLMDVKKDTTTSTTKFTYTTVAGDTVEKIQKNTKANPKKLALTDIRTKNTQILAKYPKDNQTMPAGLVLVMESYILAEALGDGASPDRANVKGGEDHLTQAFTKLKKTIEVLESPKDKGIGVDVKFLNDITSKSLDSKNKEVIKSLFTEINRYLVGDKKETLNASTTPLYKESMEIISDKNKKIVVAEKIARFAKTALQFDKEGLYGGLGETGKGLQTFVEGIKSIMTVKPSEQKAEVPTTETKFKVGDVVKWKNKEGKEISKKIEKVKDGSYFFTTSDGKEYSKKESELTKESIINRYNKFLSYIKEAEETQGEVSDPVNMTTSQKIKDWWDKKVDIKEFVLTRSQSEKIRISIEKAEKRDAVTITGLDPIIEIIKVFNRAYKLHTTQVISTGRSGGKVSNKTFMEYTSFGGGSPDSAGASGGPYRNNVIFNQWENAVQNIIKDTKYQKIFREETILKTSEGNDIKEAGKNLLRFMNDMLDGDTLYKSKSGDSTQGKQAEFIEKYFGPTDADKKKLEKGGLTMGGEKEAEEINGVADSMPKEKNLDFTDKLLKFESNDELEGTFFAAKTMLNGESRQIYFYVQGIESEYAYVSYCGSMGFFKKYIIESGNTIKMEKNKLEYSIKTDLVEDNNKQFIIKGFRMKVVSLINKEGKFLLSGSHSIKFIQSFDGSKNNPSTKSVLGGKEDEINFQSFFTLQEKLKDDKGQEVFSRFKLKNPSNSIRVNGGFTNIINANDIKNTSIIKK